MKVAINSVWDSRRHRPNVCLVLKPEDQTEVALMRSLYGVKGKILRNMDGQFMLDFFPDGGK